MASESLSLYPSVRSGWCGTSVSYGRLRPPPGSASFEDQSNCLALCLSSLPDPSSTRSNRQLQLAIGIPTSSGCLENRDTSHPITIPLDSRQYIYILASSLAPMIVYIEQLTLLTSCAEAESTEEASLRNVTY